MQLCYTNRIINKNTIFVFLHKISNITYDDSGKAVNNKILQMRYCLNKCMCFVLPEYNKLIQNAGEMSDEYIDDSTFLISFSILIPVN